MRLIAIGVAMMLCSGFGAGMARSQPKAHPAATPLADGAAPGGFLELSTSTHVRSPVTPSLPTRGKFTFPAPYQTTGVRLTNATDCGGSDCVEYVGYSYWRNMNNHVGSTTMLVFVTLARSRGGSGPTLFSYDKTTDNVALVEPLFDPSSPLSWATGEGWYWSATLPTALYVNQGMKLYRYEVLSRRLETVFDAAPEFGSDHYIWQIHSSDDDRVHSATLRVTSSGDSEGCLVYHEDTATFSYFAKMGDFDECQVDKSGRWLLIKENVDGAYGEDNRIIDLQAGLEKLFLDEDGAAGHSDNGHDYMIAEDNWAELPGAVRVWSFGSSLPGLPPQGQVAYHTTDWAVDVGHISHTNARPGVPLDQQFACLSHVGQVDLPRANEIVCFRLDSSLQVLVVAPVMTKLSALGGTDEYARRPKGNLDVTGRYFIWTSNVGGNRLDAFIAKVPSQLLVPSNGGGTPTFVDVPLDHVFYAFIEALAARGITAGCSTSPPQYCPDVGVKRDQMAVFLLRGIHGAGYQPPDATGTMFTDVPLSHPLAKWIEELARENITAGCSTSPLKYCPDAGVTRGQMAVFLLRPKHGAAYQPPAATGTMFSDVPLTHPLVNWIEQLAREGISAGCQPTTYCPDVTATRGQMAVFLVRTFNLPM
jgi:hypothetical protein